MTDKGQVLRHSCPLPAAARGLIWRCDCGRRWKVITQHDPYRTVPIYAWTRRYLPWNGSTP